MRSNLISAVLGLCLLPAAAFAQNHSQTAAIDSAAPAVAAPAPSSDTGITRAQYLQRAQERAAQRAGARFDQMDANHDGVLDRAEIRAWRSQHRRHASVQPAQPTAQ